MWLRGAGTGAVCLRPEPTPSLQQIKIESFFHGKSVLWWRPEYFNELHGPDVLALNILDLKQVAHSDCKSVYPSFPGS